MHSTRDATAFVRRLLAEEGDAVADLEVRRASLEDAYIALVHAHEGAGEAPAAPLFREAS